MTKGSQVRRLLNLPALRMQHNKIHLSDGLQLTRRQLLGLAGIAVAAAPVKAVHSAIGDRFVILERDGYIGFWVNDEERWAIDIKRFSGSPKLNVEHTGVGLRIVLSGAFYPGTPIPANLVCELDSLDNTARMKLWMEFGDFNCDTPFISWLNNEIDIHSNGDIKSIEWNVFDAKVRIQGKSTFKFNPDWSILCTGKSIATLGIDNHQARSGFLTINLLQHAELLRSLTNATRLRLDRGKSNWDLVPPTASFNGDNWQFKGNEFDTLIIESAIASSGSVHHAIQAVAGKNSQPLHYNPDIDLRDFHNRPFFLPLNKAVCTWTKEAGIEEAYLTADIDDTPKWLIADNCSFEVSGKDAKTFEMHTRNGRIAHTRCVPTVTRINMAMPGASVSPAIVEDGHLDLHPVQYTIIKKRPQPTTGNNNTTNTQTNTTTGATRDRAKVPVIIIPRKPPTGDNTTPPNNNGTTTAPDSTTGRTRIPSRDTTTGRTRAPIRRRDDTPVIIPPRRDRKRIDPGRVVITPGDFTASIVRPSDLLALNVTFKGFVLQVNPNGASTLVSTMPDACIVLEFPTQNISEAYYLFKGTDTLTDKDAFPPIPTLAAGSSRLSFGPYNKGEKITYHLSDILTSCSNKPIIVTGSAHQPPVTHHSPTPPTDKETAIECPRGLIISPNEKCTWTHSANPVKNGQYTELWHTRLGGSNRNTPNSSDRTMRVIYAPDFQNTANDLRKHKSYQVAMLQLKKLFKMNISINDSFALHRFDRHQLVKLMGDTTIPGADNRFMTVEMFTMSSLGAWMKTRYAADLPNNPSQYGLDIVEWRHEAMMGRDQYIRVVHQGNLYPFGHPAVWVDIWERRFMQGAAGPTAYLLKRSFVVVQQPTVNYPDNAYGKQNSLPFRSVTLKTLITPNLDQTPTHQPFGFPYVSGNQFIFHLSGKDWDGRNIEFSSPLIWVSAGWPLNLTSLSNAYKPVNERGFDSQKIAFAPSSKEGDTSFFTNKLRFDAEAADGKIRFKAILSSASIKSHALQTLSPAAGDAYIDVGYHNSYKASGFNSGNAGEVLFELTGSAKPAVKFATDQIGGLANPNLDVTALSRKFGPIGGDIASFAQGNFDPGSFFSDAVLLGGIKLAEIILNKFAAATVPKLTSYVDYDNSGKPLAENISYSWEPSLKLDHPLLKCTGGTTFHLTAKITTPIGTAGSPQTTVSGVMQNFKISLFDMISLPFTTLGFYSQTGQKTRVVAEMGALEFSGPLAFVGVLAKIIPSDGFSDPPAVDVSTSGVVVSYSQALPDISLGYVSASNLSLNSALTVPFTGDPVSFRFAFAERNSPFIVAGNMLAGGGFFGLTIDMHGIKQIEASLEFGGSVSINVGVASGGISIMVGIYFALNKDTGIVLTGYVRACGAVEVLGLVCISIEFMMSLTYMQQGNQVIGEATVTVSIHIAFFSKSVSFSVQKQFAGNSSAMLPDSEYPSHLLASDYAGTDSAINWDEYCAAFAPSHTWIEQNALIA